MNRPRRMGALMRLALLASLGLSAVLGGCIKDFGTGGTGELVVPPRELREVKASDLSSLSTTRPTTATTTRPTTLPAELALTIEECRQLSLASNLNLQVELLNPSIARESLSAEEARYEAIFSANVNYAKTDAPTFTTLVGSQTDSVNADAGITLPLRTGGSLKFDVPASRFETNNVFSTLNPAYTGDYVVTFSQPLLRGAGFGVNAQPIRVAFYGYQQAQARTKLEVIRVLADVDRVYWRLYAARRELEVRKQEHELAVAQLERARRQVAAGAAAEPEIVRAESGVADRVE